MKKRRMAVKRSKDKKIFSSTARKTRGLNVINSRGGIRL